VVTHAAAQAVKADTAEEFIEVYDNCFVSWFAYVSEAIEVRHASLCITHCSGTAPP
jgi:hypothetical protein